jgi:hypothetical protein
METDASETGGEVLVAYEVYLPTSQEVFDLEKLTLDHLRKLSKNCGINYVNNRSKFQCRKALQILASFQEQRERDGLNLLTATERTNSNIIRLVNVIFSNDFFPSLLKLNNIKTRTSDERIMRLVECQMIFGVMWLTLSIQQTMMMMMMTLQSTS